MKMVAAALFLSLAATASAQDVLITPGMRAGDTFKLEVNRTRENSPASPQDGKGSKAIDVTVLTATPEGFTIEWVSSAPTGNVGSMAEGLMLTAGGAMRGMKPVIRLTPKGEVVGLVNEAEVLAKLQAAVDFVRRDLVETAPPADLPRLEAILGQIMSPAMLLASVVREAGIYFRLSGVELEVGESVTTGLMQPNPFGGEPLSATFTIRLESATTGTASFVTTTAPEVDALKRAAQLLLQITGERVSPEELAKFPPMQLTDEGRFVFDRGVGLMSEVVSTQRVTMASRSRLERTEIRLVATPKR